MNSCNQIRVFANMGLILFAPFNPFVVLVDYLYFD